MSHRLLHSLVFSSVLALDATGCTTSHGLPAMPPSPDAEGLSIDGGVLPTTTDASVPPVPTDAFVPPVPTDAFIPAPSPDASIPPDAFVPGDDRFCEEGWPTTKATSCIEVEGMPFLRCCSNTSPEVVGTCCLLDPAAVGA